MPTIRTSDGGTRAKATGSGSHTFGGSVRKPGSKVSRDHAGNETQTPKNDYYAAKQSGALGVKENEEKLKIVKKAEQSEQLTAPPEPQKNQFRTIGNFNPGRFFQPNNSQVNTVPFKAMDDLKFEKMLAKSNYSEYQKDQLRNTQNKKSISDEYNEIQTNVSNKIPTIDEIGKHRYKTVSTVFGEEKAVKYETWLADQKLHNKPFSFVTSATEATYNTVREKPVDTALKTAGWVALDLAGVGLVGVAGKSAKMAKVGSVISKTPNAKKAGKLGMNAAGVGIAGAYGATSYNEITAPIIENGNTRAPTAGEMGTRTGQIIGNDIAPMVGAYGVVKGGIALKKGINTGNLKSFKEDTRASVGMFQTIERPASITNLPKISTESVPKIETTWKSREGLKIENFGNKGLESFKKEKESLAKIETTWKSREGLKIENFGKKGPESFKKEKESLAKIETTWKNQAVKKTKPVVIGSVILNGITKGAAETTTPSPISPTTKQFREPIKTREPERIKEPTKIKTKILEPTKIKEIEKILEPTKIKEVTRTKTREKLALPVLEVPGLEKKKKRKSSNSKGDKAAFTNKRTTNIYTSPLDMKVKKGLI